MRIVHHGLNIFLVLMLLVFAALQWNDPDPYIWIPVYLFFAILGVLVWIRPLPDICYLIALILAVAFAIVQRPEAWEGFGESMLTENMERARESAGLVICAICASYFWWMGKRALKKNL
jgi:hypothetical protein